VTPGLATTRLAPGLDEGKLWGTAAAREMTAGSLPFPFATALAFCSLIQKIYTLYKKHALYKNCA